MKTNDNGARCLSIGHLNSIALELTALVSINLLSRWANGFHHANTATVTSNYQPLINVALPSLFVPNDWGKPEPGGRKNISSRGVKNRNFGNYEFDGFKFEFEFICTRFFINYVRDRHSSLHRPTCVRGARAEGIN